MFIWTDEKSLPPPLHHRIEWITHIYVIWMLLLFPVFWGFNGYHSITISKYLFFSVSTCIWLFALIVFSIVEAAGNKSISFRLGPVQWAVLSFLAINCISAASSPYGTSVIMGAGRYDGLVTILLYGAVFLGVSLTAKPNILYVYCFWPFRFCLLCRCNIAAFRI